MSTTGMTGDNLSETRTDWGEIEISRKEQFLALDARVRQIEEILKGTWVELAEICVTVQSNELWREGGYHSWNAWLMDACPACRSTAYAAIANLAELKDVPREDLKEITPSNASILAGVPRKQRNGKLLKAAKTQTSKEFTATVIREAPEAHVEQRICHKFRLTGSTSKRIQAGFEMWRVLNDDLEAPKEASLEGIVIDYMLSHQDEYERKKRNGVSRR